MHVNFSNDICTCTSIELHEHSSILDSPEFTMLTRLIKSRSYQIPSLTSLSTRYASTGETKQHVVDKDTSLDPQDTASVKGRQEKVESKAGGKVRSTATAEKGPLDTKKKIAEEFPEAPKGSTIGFEDERGGVSCVLFIMAS